MTDLISDSPEAAHRFSGDSADETSYVRKTVDLDRRPTGRHRAAEEPEDQGVATLLPGGVGAAAFHAAIDAARTSVSRQPIERLDDDTR